ncbi:hypothetical protein JB92DRAFT_3131821 [Gautieria morchelliformis]|nr:hypothetical protein JB92DRAFT_3131821 [Gautieria morchelliformis]
MPSPTPIADPGDPVAILRDRGINEDNRTDIAALATALETFGDFKRGTTWNVGKEGATQLIAITRLVREASLLYGANRLVTNNDLQKMTAKIKEAISSSNISVLSFYPLLCLVSYFVGVWDTVAAMGVISSLLPFTMGNLSIKMFRHVVSLDECRALEEALVQVPSVLQDVQSGLLISQPQNIPPTQRPATPRLKHPGSITHRPRIPECISQEDQSSGYCALRKMQAARDSHTLFETLPKIHGSMWQATTQGW